MEIVVLDYFLSSDISSDAFITYVSLNKIILCSPLVFVLSLLSFCRCVDLGSSVDVPKIRQFFARSELRLFMYIYFLYNIIQRIINII